MSFKILTALFLVALSHQLYALDATTMPYQDDKFSCISSADADRYVHDFGVNVSSFGGRELCDSKIEFKKLMNDFSLIEKGQFSTGQNLFIKDFISANQYYSWMKSQTRGVDRGNDVPYATAYNSGGYFTMQDGWAKLSTLGRVGTVIHEARHTAGYRHVPCQQGTYQGSSVLGCDSSYSYGGSHAIEMEYYARVSVLGTNFHPVYQKMARLMAIARSNIFFNVQVIQKKESLMALSADRKKAFILTEKNQWATKEVPFVGGELKRTSFGAVIFNLQKAFAIDPYQNSGFSDVVEDVYSYFKLLGEGSDKLKDLEEYDVGVKRYVTQITSTDLISNYDFPNGQWGKSYSLPFSVKTTATSVPSIAKTGYFLIENNGSIFQYEPQSGRLVSVNTNWDFSNQRVILYNNETLLLKKTGEIKKWLSSHQETVWPTSVSLGLVSDLVSIPLYDGFKVVLE